MAGPPDYITQRVSLGKRYDRFAHERSMMGVIRLVTRHIEFQQAIGIAVGAKLKPKLQTLSSVLLEEFLMRPRAGRNAHWHEDGHEQQPECFYVTVIPIAWGDGTAAHDGFRRRHDFSPSCWGATASDPAACHRAASLAGLVGGSRANPGAQTGRTIKVSSAELTKTPDRYNRQRALDLGVASLGLIPLLLATGIDRSKW